MCIDLGSVGLRTPAPTIQSTSEASTQPSDAQKMRRDVPVHPTCMAEYPNSSGKEAELERHISHGAGMLDHRRPIHPWPRAGCFLAVLASRLIPPTNPAKQHSAWDANKACMYWNRQACMHVWCGGGRSPATRGLDNTSLVRLGVVRVPAPELKSCVLHPAHRIVSHGSAVGDSPPCFPSPPVP